MPKAVSMSCGCMVALFGPDGSGKSTVADLLEDLCHADGLATRRCHWRPRVLPSLVHQKEFDTSRPDELPARPKAVSLGMYLYFFLDFLLGYLIRLRPLLRRGTIVIYERYFYDLLFHPKRYKLQRFSLLARLLTQIAPTPGLIVLLYGAPSIIFSRKPELPYDEIVAQQSMMRRELPRFGRLLQMDVTALAPPEVARAVYASLLLGHDRCMSGVTDARG